MKFCVSRWPPSSTWSLMAWRLQTEDIRQALHYAAESVREREIPIRAAS
jgi:hypothetical protein